jgi:diadenosine tetraphosphate (Ap4A) HIT family hydrolase
MSTRFGWVASGFGEGPHPVCDRDLLNHHLAAVVPTLGSLVPGWVLIVPKAQCLSFKDLPRNQRQDLLALGRSLETELKAFGRDTFIFEHGPCKPLSGIGCGVDQSHLHVVAMDGDLSSKVLADNSVVWMAADARDPWTTCRDDQEYLLICEKGACYIGFPRVAQSQYFRRKIAEIRGMPDAWDYREWPFHENAQRTIEHFTITRTQRRAA